MISIDFEYYRAHTIDEALGMYSKLNDEGKSPLFFNGGTEIITLMRVYAFYTDARAVIDIKSIPECRYTGFQGNQLVIGSSISLAQIEEMPEFPLLSKGCSRIADHTSREKITLGGNICGHIKYKEAVLPLLLTDCDLVIASESGVSKMPIQEIFNKEMMLDPGSFIVQVLVDKKYLNMPFVSKKMTRIGRIGYPLLTVSAIQVGERARFAISGLCEFPFRSSSVEDTLNNLEQSVEERITNAISQLPAPILDDVDGSFAFREFVLRGVLTESLTELRGDEEHGTNI